MIVSVIGQEGREELAPAHGAAPTGGRRQDLERGNRPKAMRTLS